MIIEEYFKCVDYIISRVMLAFSMWEDKIRRFDYSSVVFILLSPVPLSLFCLLIYLSVVVILNLPFIIFADVCYHLIEGSQVGKSDGISQIEKLVLTLKNALNDKVGRSSMNQIEVEEKESENIINEGLKANSCNTIKNETNEQKTDADHTEENLDLKLEMIENNLVKIKKL
jgi:hypothetical protein